MKSAALLLAQGFEEVEAVAPIDILRRGEVTTDVISISDHLDVCGARNIIVKADLTMAQADFSKYDMLILPGGGPGVDNLIACPEVLEQVRNFVSENRLVGAICAAPKVLVKAGVINDRTVTSYPSLEPEISGQAKAYSQERVVEDGNIISSRAAGTALEFGLALLKALQGPDVSEKVKSEILAC